MKKNKLTVILLILPFLALAQNLALGKSATQSTDYFNNASFYASVAVDGNTGNFTHTDNGPDSWWRVDLGGTYTINRIVIYNRTSSCCINRLNGSRVLVGTLDSNDPNNYTEVFILDSQLIQEQNGLSVQGRFLMVHQPGSDPLSLAEVEVYGSAGSSDTQSPTAPTLSSSTNTDTTVDLSWSGATDDTAVTDYKIFKDGVLEATLGNVTSYQVTGLTASTQYNFTVTALDAANNESVASNAVSVTTDASSGGGGSVWSESNSVASYTGDVGIGIGTIPSGYKLAVDGKIITEELKVQLQSAWPDYVFAKDYDLPSLKEIQKYIQEQGHLPNMPSAKEVEANGLEVGEMNRLLLEKIEELTLYVIDLKVQQEQLKNQNSNLSRVLEKVLRCEKKLEALSKN